jgi:hypothetical protein
VGHEEWHIHGFGDFHGAVELERQVKYTTYDIRGRSDDKLFDNLFLGKVGNSKISCPCTMKYNCVFQAVQRFLKFN